MNLFAEISSIVASELGSKPEDVKPESSLIRDLGATSIDFMSLIFALEDKFNIDLGESELGEVRAGAFKPEQLIDGQYLAPELIEKFSGWLPDIKGLSKVKPEDLAKYITVASLEKVIQKQLVRKNSPA